MKTLGIIGGIGPESTIEYYRFIIASYREKKRMVAIPPSSLTALICKKQWT